MLKPELRNKFEWCKFDLKFGYKFEQDTQFELHLATCLSREQVQDPPFDNLFSIESKVRFGYRLGSY